MNAETLFGIGELARRTGLTVRTVRYYADAGIVPPTGRSPAGHRLYDLDALARLGLVRTLRELGLGLADMRRVLAREVSVPGIAAAHADALDTQIRTLRLRRAVLRAVAARTLSPEELNLMHRLAKLNDAERRHLVNDFIDAAFNGLDANPEFVEMMRSAMPELPEEPEPEQIEAWVELAQLCRDEGFRAAVRRMAEHQAAERSESDTTGLHPALTEEVRTRVNAALDAGISPPDAAAGPVVDALTSRYAEVFGRPDDAALRSWILERLEAGSDPRAERYWQLLAVVNGWPVPPTLVPVFVWFMDALRERVEV